MAASCCNLQQAQRLGSHCGMSLSFAASSTSASVAAAAEPKKLLIVCRKRDRGDKEFLPYHVTVVTPPPKHLGVHSLPPNTQCGETVTVKGEPYIVSGVTYRYQLRRGKYEAKQKRLDVQSTGRYLVNLYLDNLLESS
ncbi:unnamed protein product [Calypogeia fissa]